MTRHPLSHRQARQLMDTAYLAAATALLWIALYYLPVGSPLFRLALPLPLAITLACFPFPQTWGAGGAAPTRWLTCCRPLTSLWTF